MNLPIHPLQHKVVYFQLTHNPLSDIFSLVNSSVLSFGRWRREYNRVRSHSSWAIDRQHGNRSNGSESHWKRNTQCHPQLRPEHLINHPVFAIPHEGTNPAFEAKTSRESTPRPCRENRCQQLFQQPSSWSYLHWPLWRGGGTFGRRGRCRTGRRTPAHTA